MFTYMYEIKKGILLFSLKTIIVKQPIMPNEIIPKNIAIQMLVDGLCCTDELSENVVDLVSVVVIPWIFGVDDLREKSDQFLHTAGSIVMLRKKLIILKLNAYRYRGSSNKIQTEIDKLK